jgi:hypothetical protein
VQAEQAGKGVLAALPHVDISPVLASAYDVGKDVVNALELKLPTTRLLDRVMPDALERFDLRSVFPNFAGLRLEDLFENLKLPAGASDRVAVTHGVDPQSLRGWLQVAVDQPFTDTITVFTFAGLSARVRGGRFQAVSRMEGGVGQAPRQIVRGEISGDWEMEVGGFQLVTIERTALRFDDSGRITFDVRPERVRLPGVMAWLSDLVSRLGMSESGFSFRITPSGVQLALDLPLPDVQAGAFALANLRLGFRFGIQVVPEFALTAGANFATRAAPFTLTVFVLGGAGWFDFWLAYVPARRELTAGISIGIMAAAGLAIRLGPIGGSIYAYFGIAVEYVVSRNKPSTLRIVLILRFVGRVSLLGIVTAYLEIGLEATYTSGGGLVGRGYVSVKVKICWCFTLKVSCSVSYSFGKSKGGGTQALRSLASAVAPRALPAMGVPAPLVDRTAREALAVPSARAGFRSAASDAAPFDTDVLLADTSYQQMAQYYVDMFI